MSNTEGTLTESPMPTDIPRIVGNILLRGRLRSIGIRLVWSMASKKEKKLLKANGIGPEEIDLSDLQDVIEEMIAESIEISQEGVAHPSFKKGSYDTQNGPSLGDLDIILEGLDEDDEAYSILRCFQKKLIQQRTFPHE